MISKDDIDYESLEQALVDSEAEITAAELQGAITGLMSAGHKAGSLKKTVLVDLLGEQEQRVMAQLEPLVKVLFEWTDAQLNQPDSLAPMILPDDSYPAIDQLEETVNWCLGFLFGFGLQSGDRPIESTEVKESLIDIADISQLELEAADDEETQEALFTLIEHIKVAVQIIHLELVVKPSSGLQREASEKPTLH
jgi:uncharacterized protein YgfB (UPF0149 family)